MMQTRALESGSPVLAVLDELEQVFDSEEARRSMFSFEDSHLVQLMLVDGMFFNLDCMLHLLSTVDMLPDKMLGLQLTAQADNQPDMHVLVDPCSLLRNKLILHMYFIGGALDWKHPTLGHDSGPLLSTLPPQDFLFNHSAEDSEPRAIGADDSPTCHDPVEQLIQSLNLHSMHNLKVFRDRLRQMIPTLPQHFVNPIQLEPTPTTCHTCPTAIQSVVQILHRSYLSESSPEQNHVSALCRLLNCTKPNSQDKVGDQEVGIWRCDWFMALVYLVFQSYDESIHFLHHLSTKQLSFSIWPLRELYSEAGSAKIGWIDVLCDWVELIVEMEVPIVHSILTLSGLPVSLVFRCWWSQCFFNFLDLADIMKYLLLSTTFGAGYPCYFSAALLRHLEASLRAHST
eukprot:TRINITY_DN20669_c0_g1_i2.p1 TRINITY_DN20669_c0_g1~~TRINITY_DN20669_c0_g1_i2.p1  ORF type:complete len:400 (-),score=50.12 TRINITY_DN20669_c0_g1_i2:353-1552(-)